MTHPLNGSDRPGIAPSEAAETRLTAALEEYLEAQEAAGLHHTNIVPVHYVGCERGIHFYAMQFIEGHTLAEVIAQRRQLAGRDRGEQSPVEEPTGSYR